MQPWPLLCPSQGRWWWGSASGLEETLFRLWETQKQEHGVGEIEDTGGYISLMCREVFLTYFIHHFNHLLQLIGADVRAVSEPKIDEDPLAQEVLALGGFVVVIDERKRTPQRCSADWFGPLFFNHCKVQPLTMKDLLIRVFHIKNAVFTKFIYILICVFCMSSGKILTFFLFFL